MRYFVCPQCDAIEATARQTVAVIHEHEGKEFFLYVAEDRKDSRLARSEFSRGRYEKLAVQMEARRQREEFKDVKKDEETARSPDP